MSTDRIEKQIFLRAPQARVWRAISDAKEFGAWFGVALEGPLTPGARVKGRITTPGYDHLTVDLWVERVEPEKLVAYRWHPYAIDPKKDYSDEPTTLVELALEVADGGTKLTVSESGFDRIPAERRAEAFRMNGGGWDIQVKNIERHVTS